MRAKCTVDGRGNAGNEGACAAHLILEDGSEFTRAVKLGEVTNNEAEYEGVALGMRLALEKDVDTLLLFCDSRLVVNQVHGFYRVNNLNLASYHACVIRLSHKFDSFVIEWVRRTETKVPDFLCRDLFGKAPRWNKFLAQF